MKLTNMRGVLLLLPLLLLNLVATAQNMINPADYHYWRELAFTNELYVTMKADAIRTAQASTPTSPTRDAMGANALAYILDPENKNLYVENIKASFDTIVVNLHIGNDAVTSSVRSHELFFALLALDVVGGELEKETLARYQASLQEKVMKLVVGKWDPHGWAMRMLWYKYIGDEENFRHAKAEWEIGLTEHFMPDGVSPAGSIYCIQRWTTVARTAKNLSIDMMEYMGYHEYYTNPAIIAHQEFMYGYATSPFGRGISFGDSRHTSIGEDMREDGYILSPTTVRGARFSPEAHKYAMWVLGRASNTQVTDQKLKGYLPNYLIMAGTAAANNPLNYDTTDGVLAQSRLFDNYASLIEHVQSTDALHLAMQTITGNTEYHTHYEVNAIGMAGYGEILLRNAGYDGPNRNVTVDGVTASYDYMHSSSESSNCVMLGGKRHASKEGEGIVEGFTGYDIEYFRGSTGKDEAIAGNHQRDVVFMQPAEGANGYYLVMDHVVANKSDEMVNVVWHPNSAELEPITPQTAYLSQIKVATGAKGPQLYSANEAILHTFLATPPTSIDVKTTVNQESVRHIPEEQHTSYVAQYMLANYQAVEGEAAILTVLFAGDKNHQVGEMARIESDGGYTGAVITQGAVQDVALTSTGVAVGAYSDVTFQGEDVVYRTEGGKMIAYFVRGVAFRGEACGFESDAPVALHIKSGRGVVTSQGATVKLYAPQIKAVNLGGESAKLNRIDANCVEVTLPTGTYALEIL